MGRKREEPTAKKVKVGFYLPANVDEALRQWKGSKRGRSLTKFVAAAIKRQLEAETA